MIIVGVDESATARGAALEAAELAHRYQRPLHLVRSLTQTSTRTVRGGAPESWHVDAVAMAEDHLRGLVSELGASVEVTFAVLADDPASALVNEAARLDASFIVVGNKRVQGAARVLGSVAGDVAKHAPCNVLIVHTH